MNPITPEDLFAPEFSEKIGEVIAKLERGLAGVTAKIDDVKKKAGEMNEQFKNPKSPIPTDAPKKVQELNDEFKVLLQEYGIYKTEISQVTAVARDQNTILKLQAQYAKSAEGSYNKLSAEYRLLKVAMNEIGTVEKGEIKRLEVMKKRAAELYEQMNKYQKETGKYTLQVGDYSKALNGLSISTQQVLREMPTLANSLQQFFIAISNNVPIFVDNLQRVQKETGSWKIAMKGVLTSLFSWQTALLVLLTILPKIAKNIHDKRKAQEEANREDTKALSLTERLGKVYNETAKAEASNVAKLRVLYAISQDVNRTMEDRHKASEILKKDYQETFKNLTAEEIVLGKAKVAYDELTQSLMKQAKARAYMDAITKAYTEKVDIKADLDKAREAKREAELELKRQTDILIRPGLTREDLEGVNQMLGKYQKAVDDADAKVTHFDYTLQVNEEQIRKLEKEIPVLDMDIKSLGDTTKDTAEEMKDYYWEWAESVIDIIDNEVVRELVANDLRYEKARETYQKILDEGKANGTLTIEQQKYINDILLNLDTERENAREKIMSESTKKISDKWASAIKDIDLMEGEEDISNILVEEWQKALAQQEKIVTEGREKLERIVLNGTYREAQEEAKVFKQSLADKLKAEAEYSKQLLKMRLETGQLTQSQYDIEVEKVESRLSSALAKLNKRRGKKFSLWTALFGEKKVDKSTGEVFKELSAEAQSFVNAFQQSMSLAIGYMNEWMDKRIEMAEVAVEAARKESEAAKTALDYEMEARANGYANNVELARKEYEDKLDLEKKAVEEKKRLEKIQESVDTAQQISSLITATAELWAAHAGIPVVGSVLAAAATAAMWGSFAAAKIQAAQLAKAKTYGNGGMEYIDYGGSHASGNDVDFGRTKDGRSRRVERGEVVGIINKRNVDKYGVNNIRSVINSLNDGSFEKRFGQMGIVVGSTKDNALAEMYSLAFNLGNSGADLSNIERGINTLVEQNEVRVVPTAFGRIEYRGNNKRIIRNS